MFNMYIGKPLMSVAVGYEWSPLDMNGRHWAKK
jgi:hypothetical protein